MFAGLKDQTGHFLALRERPKRIVSLVPSQTELLSYFELDNEVVGITKFCIHPENWFKQKTRVGGTKHVHFEIIDKLQPDLIIANKEENTAEDIIELRKKYPTYTSDIFTLEDALQMILDLGILTGKELSAKILLADIQSAFESTKKIEGSVAYLIWQKPYMLAGSHTFIDAMLAKCGLKNICEKNTRYPEMLLEEIAAQKPDYIFLSSEPFPFDEHHQNEIKAQLSSSKIVLVDGEMFSWYGSRLLSAPKYFAELLEKIAST